MKETIRSGTEEFIFRSKLPDISFSDHLPLHSFCFQNLPELSTRPCLVNSSTGDTYTYAEVDLTARQVSFGLELLGIHHGDVVLLLLHNSPEFVFAFLGASLLGAPCTTANPLYTPAEIEKQARASGAKLVITHASYVDKVRKFSEENRLKVVCTDSPPEGCLHFSELVKDPDAKAAAEIRPEEDVVALPFSSGTTGLPKGVMITHKCLVTSIAQQLEGENPVLDFRRDDVIVCVLPLFHIYSMNMVMLCGIRAGATIVMMHKFEVGRMMELVEKYKVSIAPVVPPIVAAITKSPLVEKYDLSSIRMLVTGGSPIGKELEDAVRTKLPNAILGQGYGMTEGGAISMSLAFARKPFKTKSGSCGTVIRNSEIKVIDPETGISLPRNQSGEICIRGNQIMKGYINDPEATKRTIDKDGWLHTGDIGYVDDDDEVFIVDRLKELIKYKGFQVAPAELESILTSHPNVSDAAVVPMKDEVSGEVPVAFVVRANGSNVGEDEIKQYISKQVVYYKRISRIFFIDAIPKAPSGKTLRKQLKATLSSVVST